jgi:hypothetical protein
MGAPNPVSPVATTTAAAPSSADAATAGASASMNTDAAATASTKFSSLEDLKNKAPKVYYQMMVSIATTMIKDMHRNDENLKKMWRESRENA